MADPILFFYIRSLHVAQGPFCFLYTFLLRFGLFFCDSLLYIAVGWMFTPAENDLLLKEGWPTNWIEGSDKDQAFGRLLRPSDVKCFPCPGVEKRGSVQGNQLSNSCRL